ncbi:hypothetical protein WH87_02490 [Devosia epidermidihirudinis]|uniref:Uncharacterized protein n=1 Tax=Devosia epidermidihirudinis TaxID=1293439 RepID=A0A0F5QJY8_9HYPH|nr:hypothetical protein WH87_02490 [Devosia epidermidihirudinis]
MRFSAMPHQAAISHDFNPTRRAALGLDPRARQRATMVLMTKDSGPRVKPEGSAVAELHCSETHHLPKPTGQVPSPLRGEG